MAEERRSLLKRLWRPDELGPNRLSTDHGQPLGAKIDLTTPTGYYLDMRIKAHSPSWPQPWFKPEEDRELWVAVAQLGLGLHERFVSGEGEEWLEAAIAVGDDLLRHQRTEGAQRGGWVHSFAYPHTYRLVPPWLSAMAQGEAASLLVRLARITSDGRYAEAAVEAMRPMRRPSSEGGVVARLDGGVFLEEYPTDPPSYVLNGGIFALWGCYDVAVGLGDDSARALFDEAVETLAGNIDRYDLGYWSRYDLFPHRLTNISSLAYHRLHTDQLRATALISGLPVFDEVASRFTRYGGSWVNAAHATLRKIAFRALVPRRHR